mgnify:CR=1 FL=1
MKKFKFLVVFLTLSIQAYGQSTTVNLRSLKTHYGAGTSGTG